MVLNSIQTHIAYRCPSCFDTVFGFVGKFALNAGMIRLKCQCGESHLDIKVTNDGKLRLSIPCIFCKSNHNYVVSQSLFFERDSFLLTCPYSNMDIAFIGEKEKIDGHLTRTAEELNRLLRDLEAESIKDVQPVDLDDSDVLPDPTVYDALRFTVKDLESEGKVDCPCHKGEYDLRFCPEGIQVFCGDCGAVYTFNLHSEHSHEDYLDLEEIILR
jgi:hypothetical protein